MIAVHVGADLFDPPRYARWARPLSVRDSVDRMTRLCTAAGVGTQRQLVGAEATRETVRDAIAEAVAGYGRLVLTFSGHSERAVPGEHGGGWCLRDGLLPHAETARLLATASHGVVVADTCFATGLSGFLQRIPTTTVLIAACAEHQTTINSPVSDLIVALERLTFPNGLPNPDCRSYRWLRMQLRQDTPDAERPDIQAHPRAALRFKPFSA